VVILAGLPGTGKSLLVHQLAHLASARGRRVSRLQWDVARPAFEASAAGQRYPQVDGVTHPIIRRAAGLWARAAIAVWDREHRGGDAILVGEAPFAGGRFIELARPRDDLAEPLLASAACRFAIALPAVDVRHFLEAERERRTASPLHPREREDAPPHVLRELWRDLAVVAHRLGLGSGTTRPVPEPSERPGRFATGTAETTPLQPVADEDTPPYDPVTYRRVYESVLRHRRSEVVPLEIILPTAGLSAYDFAIRAPDLIPTEDEAERWVLEVEGQHGDLAALEREVTRWWDV